MLKKILSSTIIKLVLAVIAGILLGFVVGEGFMNVVVTLKYILGQLIFFMVPLIILAFISSSIAKMKGNASRMLGWALGLAYLSSVGAAFMAMFLGYWLIPLLTISPATEGLKEIPELVFKLDIPPVMSVMTALVVAIMVGLATVWTKSQIFETILDNFQKMVLLLINRILIPILPFFIAANFCALSYEGSITRQLPVFLNVMGIVLTAHFIWLFFLYLSAGVFSGKNPWQVVRYYGPAYLTAVGADSRVGYRLSKLTDTYELENKEAERPADKVLGINMIRLPEMYYIAAECLLEKDYDEALRLFDEVLEHRGLDPLENWGEGRNRLNMEAINSERYRELIGEGQTFFNMKRQNLTIMGVDGETVIQPSKKVYVVPVPDIENDYRN